MALGLTGCAGFFVPNSTTTGTTTTSTGDYVYTVNNTTNTLTGYVIGSSTLTAVTGTPLTLETGLAVRSVVVSRANAFVYVGGSGAINCYSIGTAGVLTAVSAGSIQATANFVSLTTSLDGKWLLGLDSTTQTIYVYAANASTGALTLTNSMAYSSPSAGTASAPLVVPTAIRIAANNGVVAIALGTAGTEVFTFNDTTGALAAVTNIYAPGYSDNAVLFDGNSAYLYIARTILTAGTSGVSSYSVTGLAVATQVQALAGAGGGPASLSVDQTGTYLYAGNRTDGTLTGFTLASGTATALASAPYASSAGVSALVRDNSGKYIVALGNSGSSDVTLYAFDALSAGKLDAVAVASTGSAAASAAIAATHTSSGT